MRARDIPMAVAMIVAAAAPFTVCAQGSPGSGPAYPAKAVRVIVPFPPGAGVDIAIRLITPKLTETFGQQFVADNRPGAAGNIGAEIASRAPADGYTLLAAGAPAAISQTLYPK